PARTLRGHPRQSPRALRADRRGDSPLPRAVPRVHEGRRGRALGQRRHREERVTAELAAKLKSMEHPDWVQELRDKWRRHNGAVLPISWETLDGLVDYWTENVRPWVDHEVT